MTQQYTHGEASDRYKKRLFVNVGREYKEVKAKIIEPYTPPTPVLKTREQAVLSSPSYIFNRGISSYKAQLRLLFDNKNDFAEYLMYSVSTHKFYDEKGAIYLGAAEAIRPKAVEASRRYVVEVDLILVKKDAYDHKKLSQFQDLDGVTGNEHWSKQDIEEMADLGLIAVVTKDGQPVLYFRPNDAATRAEFATFLNRTRKYLENIIRE